MYIFSSVMRLLDAVLAPLLLIAGSVPALCHAVCVALLLFDGLFPVLASRSCQGASPPECQRSGAVGSLQWWCSRWFPPTGKAPWWQGAGYLCSRCSSALRWLAKSLWSSPFWSCVGLIPAFLFLVLVSSVPTFCICEFFPTFISHKHPP